jgi:hypothetical protein
LRSNEIAPVHFPEWLVSRISVRFFISGWSVFTLTTFFPSKIKLSLEAACMTEPTTGEKQQYWRHRGLHHQQSNNSG